MLPLTAEETGRRLGSPPAQPGADGAAGPAAGRATPHPAAQPSAVVSDTNLSAELAADLDGSFERLVVRFQDELFRFAVGMTGEAGVAQEVVQDAFVNAHRALRGYDAQRVRTLALRPWLHRITLNLCRNRRRSRRPDLVFPERMPDPADAAPGPEALAVHEAERRELLDLLARLPVRLRAACVLKYGRDLSYSEIAEALGQPVGTVKANVHRGIAQLRSAVSAPRAGETPERRHRRTDKPSEECS
ncbi:MAG: RNA polymerase sigma factor [Candidatus Dormibacteria bacterium]